MVLYLNFFKLDSIQIMWSRIQLCTKNFPVCFSYVCYVLVELRYSGRVVVIVCYRFCFYMLMLHHNFFGFKVVPISMSNCNGFYVCFSLCFCLNKINRQFLCTSRVFLNLQDQSSCLKFEIIKLPSDWKGEEEWTLHFWNFFNIKLLVKIFWKSYLSLISFQARSGSGWFLCK